MAHTRAKKAKKLIGLKAKLHNKERYKEKILMKKTIKVIDGWNNTKIVFVITKSISRLRILFFDGFSQMHEKKNVKTKNEENVPEGAIPAYLLDRETQSRAKVLSNMIKQKRKEKAVSTKHKISLNEFKFKFIQL